jgi:hypothetical protein
MQHLLAGCPFSRQVWHEILGWVRSTAELPSGDTNFYTRWETSCDRSPSPARKGLASLIILTAWCLWKHRNACIFDGEQPSIYWLCDIIRDEARMWAKADATGIQNIIPGS